MNKISFILCLSVMVLFSCNKAKTNTAVSENEKTESVQKEAEQAPEPEINYLISDKNAGDFKIGDPLPSASEIYTIKKETFTENAEGDTYEVTNYTVSLDGAQLLTISPGYNYETANETDKIGEIVVFSSGFKTAKGIGINTTIDDFINAYPDYKLWYTYVSGMYVMETPGVQAQFLLDEADFTGSINITSDMIMLKRSDFKKDAKIVKIRII